MLERFQPRGFDVFAGSDAFLLATLRAGGAGCISALANANPGPMVKLADTWKQPDADRQQEALSAVRVIFQKFPMIPALKAAIAEYAKDPDWSVVRPPLVELDDAQRSALLTVLRETGFAMPGLVR